MVLYLNGTGVEGDALLQQHLAVFHLLVDFLPGVCEWMNGDSWSAIGHVVSRRLGQYSGHFLLFRLYKPVYRPKMTRWR